MPTPATCLQVEVRFIHRVLDAAGNALDDLSTPRWALVLTLAVPMHSRE